MADTAAPTSPGGHEIGDEALIDLRSSGTDGRTAEAIQVRPLIDQLAGQPPPDSAETDIRRATVRAGVLHATLESASHPLLVGQIRGAPLRGAVGYLDALYDGDLSRRQFSDVLPEQPTDFAIIRAPAGTERPAVIGLMGLGAPGELTPPVLTRAASRAIRQLVLGRVLPKVKGGSAVSCLLIGTAGPEALSIRESVRSLLDGVIDANRALRALGGHVGEVVEVELVELYADRAEIADAELVRFCDSLSRQNRENREKGGSQPPQVGCEAPRVGEGGRPGQTPTEYREGAWRRMVVRSPRQPAEQQTPQRRLEFLTMSRRAAADLGVQVVDSRKLAAIEQLTTMSVGNSQLPNTLYELLIPVDLKRDLADGSNLQLVLNEDTAELPWEMLATAPQTDVGVSTRRKPFPLATQCGLLRQLELPEDVRRRVPRAKGSDVFVLGNPPAGPLFPPLPGAAAEADAVRALFEGTADQGRGDQDTGDQDTARDVDARRSFIARGIVFDEAGQARWDTIADPELPLTVRLLDALMAHSYRVLHLAGHGAIDPATGQAGVVVGPGDFLTATELSNLPYVPDLVFLNCCHLGRIERGLPANRLAANLAVSLMGIGVRAVVAAGWAVNDAGAQRFALEFYRQLIDGADLGTAALVARAAIADTVLYGNTYGAYQIYGDPSFRLTLGGSASGEVRPIRTKSGLARALQIARVSLAGLPGDPQRQEAKRRMVDGLCDQVRERRERGERGLGSLWAELGGCYGELAAFDEAISCYRTALSDGQGDAQLRDAEQLANLLSRRAQGDAASLKEAAEEAEQILRLLLALGPSPERHGLVGGHRRRWALRSTPVDLDLLARALAPDAYGAVTRREFETSGYLAVNYLALTALLALKRTEIADALPDAQALRQRFRDRRAGKGPGKADPADVFDRLLPTELRLTGALLDYAQAKLAPPAGPSVTGESGAGDPVERLGEALTEVARGYRTQFGERSTARQQASTVEATLSWATIAQACGDEVLAAALTGLADEIRTPVRRPSVAGGPDVRPQLLVDTKETS